MKKNKKFLILSLLSVMSFAGPPVPPVPPMPPVPGVPSVPGFPTILPATLVPNDKKVNYISVVATEDGSIDAETGQERSYAFAKGSGSIAIGDRSRAITNVPFGIYGSTAIGYSSTVRGVAGTTIGSFSTATGFRNTAIGYGASVEIENKSTNFQIPDGGGVAIGDQSYVSSKNSVGLGALSNASVTRTGERAFLSDEVINENGVVSIGHKKGDIDKQIAPTGTAPKTYYHQSDYRRQIINVAGGVDDYDAVNVLQLKALNNKVDDFIKKGFNISHGGTANAIAMASIPQVSSNHYFSIGAGVGQYEGSYAFAIGLSGQNRKQNFIYKLNLGFNSEKIASFGAGINYNFGEINNEIVEKVVDAIIAPTPTVSNNNQTIIVENKELKAELAKTNERVSELERFIKDELANIKKNMNKKPEEKQKIEEQKKKAPGLCNNNKCMLIGFDVANNAVKQDSIDKLTQIVKILNENYDEAYIDVTGYTDPRAGFEYNLELGYSRAKSAVKILKELGLKDSIEIRKVSSSGSTNIIDTNKTSSGMKNNRRVEIDIYTK